MAEKTSSQVNNGSPNNILMQPVTASDPNLVSSDPIGVDIYTHINRSGNMGWSG